MLTFKFFVLERRNDDLRLRLTNNRRSVDFTTGAHVSAAELASALRGEGRHLRLESMLGRWTSVLRAYQLEMADADDRRRDVYTIAAELRPRLQGKDAPAPRVERPRGEFVEWFLKFTATKERRGTRGLYEATLRRMRDFDAEVEKRGFADIDFGWLTRFEAFMARTASVNARSIHLRNVRAVFNYALDMEATACYPFRRFKVRTEKTRKRSLTVEELRRVMTCPCEEYALLYRDMFSLIFMLIGINAVDLYGLKCVSPEGTVEYRRAKTGHFYSIKVEPEALEIIERWRGVKGLLCLADRWSDHRNFLHQCNKALQRLGVVRNKGGRLKGGEPKRNAKDEGAPKGLWPELTTYWARHTWATVAYSLGISKDVIAQALGHEDGHEVTNIYISEDPEKVDEANRRVLDWVLYGRR